MGLKLWTVPHVHVMNMPGVLVKAESQHACLSETACISRMVWTFQQSDWFSRNSYCRGLTALEQESLYIHSKTIIRCSRWYCAIHNTAHFTWILNKLVSLGIQNIYIKWQIKQAHTQQETQIPTGKHLKFFRHGGVPTSNCQEPQDWYPTLNE